MGLLGACGVSASLSARERPSVALSSGSFLFFPLFFLLARRLLRHGERRAGFSRGLFAVQVFCASSACAWCLGECLRCTWQATPATHAVLLLRSTGLSWDVDAGDERCVMHDFEKDKTVHLFFEVIMGGQQDIDVHVFSPENEELYTAAQEQEGSYSFIAKVTGRYRFCFSNEHASSANKLVSFEVTSGANIQVGRLSPPSFFSMMFL